MKPSNVFFILLFTFYSNFAFGQELKSIIKFDNTFVSSSKIKTISTSKDSLEASKIEYIELLDGEIIDSTDIKSIQVKNKKLKEYSNQRHSEFRFLAGDGSGG